MLRDEKGERIKDQKIILKKELKKAINKLMIGKAPGVDGRKADMNYGGEDSESHGESMSDSMLSEESK